MPQAPLLEFHSQVSPALPALQSLPIVQFLGVQVFFAVAEKPRELFSEM